MVTTSYLDVDSICISSLAGGIGNSFGGLNVALATPLLYQQ
jgi:hypothetical protein